MPLAVVVAVGVVAAVVLALPHDDRVPGRPAGAPAAEARPHELVMVAEVATTGYPENLADGQQVWSTPGDQGRSSEFPQQTAKSLSGPRDQGDENHLSDTVATNTDKNQYLVQANMYSGELPDKAKVDHPNPTAGVHHNTPPNHSRQKDSAEFIGLNKNQLTLVEPDGTTTPGHPSDTGLSQGTCEWTHTVVLCADKNSYQLWHYRD